MPKCREAQRTTQQDATVVVGIVSAFLVPIGRGQQRPTSIFLSVVSHLLYNDQSFCNHGTRENIQFDLLSNQGQSSLTETVVLEHHDVVVYVTIARRSSGRGQQMHPRGASENTNNPGDAEDVGGIT